MYTYSFRNVYYSACTVLDFQHVTTRASGCHVWPRVLFGAPRVVLRVVYVWSRVVTCGSTCGHVWSRFGHFVCHEKATCVVKTQNRALYPCIRDIVAS